MVYIKSTPIALIAAGSIAPALANYYNDDFLERREGLDELAELLAREYGHDLSTREFADYEALPRRGFYDVDELFQRAPSFEEDLELESRDFDPEYTELLARYFEELDEREPDPNVLKFIKNIFQGKKKDDKKVAKKAAKKAAKKEAKKAKKAAKKAAAAAAVAVSTPTPAAPAPAEAPPADAPAQDNSQPPAADAPPPDADPNAVASRELYGREDFEYEELVMRHFNDLYERGLADAAESYGLSARELEENFELLQRSPDPNVIQWFKNLFHHKKKGDKKKAATTTTSTTASQTPTSTATTSTQTDAPTPTPDAAPAADGSAPVDPSTLSSREYEELLSRYFDTLYEREIAGDVDYADVVARDFEDVELFQRSPEPNFFDWVKNIFHPKKKDAKKDDSSDVSSREFDDFYDLD